MNFSGKTFSYFWLHTHTKKWPYMHCCACAWSNFLLSISPLSSVFAKPEFSHVHVSKHESLCSMEWSLYRAKLLIFLIILNLEGSYRYYWVIIPHDCRKLIVTSVILQRKHSCYVQIQPRDFTHPKAWSNLLNLSMLIDHALGP